MEEQYDIFRHLYVLVEAIEWIKSKWKETNFLQGLFNDLATENVTSKIYKDAFASYLWRNGIESLERTTRR